MSLSKLGELILALVDVLKHVDLVRLDVRTVETNITVSTSSGKVLVLQFGQRSDLNNGVVMLLILDTVLVHLVLAKDKERPFALRSDDLLQVSPSSLTSPAEGVEWFEGIDCITAALRDGIPDFEGSIV